MGFRLGNSSVRIGRKRQPSGCIESAARPILIESGRDCLDNGKISAWIPVAAGQTVIMPAIFLPLFVKNLH
jgi:hypothetical protein